MADPSVVLSERFAGALASLDETLRGADPVVRRSDRADYQVNGSMALAKRTGRPPRDLAQDLVDRVELADIAHPPEVAGPGFINVTLHDAFLARALQETAADPCLGVTRAATTETVVVDYSAPNVAKEMHVGHLRSTIIGDALVRVLEFVGHEVIRQNHLGDWGTPFGMLIEHLLSVGEAEAANELSVGDLGRFYQEARAEFDADPDFADRARRRVVALQAGDPQTLRLWKLLVDESSRYFTAVYERLGVKLTPGRPGRREHVQPDAGRHHGRARAARPAGGERRRPVRVPARVHQPGRDAAAADRPQDRRRLRLRHHRPGGHPLPAVATSAPTTSSTSSAPRSGSTSR